MATIDRNSLGNRRTLAQEAMGDSGDVAAFDTYLTEEQVRGNVENFVGAVPVPLGLAGPVRIHGQHAQGEFLVPLATTEGALVAAYSRSARLMSACGGVETFVADDEFTRDLRLVSGSLAEARNVHDWCRSHEQDITARAEAVSRHLGVRRMSLDYLGSSVMLRLHMSTGDAMGSNMCSKAVVEVAALLETHTSAEVLGPIPIEKTPTVAGCKGKRVVASARVHRDLLNHYTRADLDTYERATDIALNTLSTQGTGKARDLHAANCIAAMFAALGQDLAYISECGQAITETSRVDEDTVAVSVTIPSLIVGTVGGGASLPAHRSALGMLGCTEPGSASKIAEIIAAMTLCGEVGSTAAVTAQEFVPAHETLGKNRPHDTHL